VQYIALFVSLVTPKYQKLIQSDMLSGPGSSAVDQQGNKWFRAYNEGDGVSELFGQ
jgi:hypothetical protein